MCAPNYCYYYSQLFFGSFLIISNANCMTFGEIFNSETLISQNIPLSKFGCSFNTKLKLNCEPIFMNQHYIFIKGFCIPPDSRFGTKS